jgi:glycosyltransferase involved in cell wall biosynthesis
MSHEDHYKNYTNTKNTFIHLPMKLTAIILTYNEELHLARCLESAAKLTPNIVVVDCFSTDKTVEIAKSYGATVLQRAWDGSHSTQVNWALDQLALLPDADEKSKWVMRIDADEILTPELVTQIKKTLVTAPDEIHGISCIRKMMFQGKLIRFGGVGANRVMRIFRRGFGQSELRWMDEHIKVEGKTIALSGAMIDDNLRPLAWWIEKHNGYSSREAVDLLNLQYQFSAQNSVASLSLENSSIGLKRWIKENIYANLPGGARSLAYFLWRYIFMLGFLDGARGTQFHFFQALWYRHLVDCKVAEVQRYIKEHQVKPIVAVKQVLGIDLSQTQ